MADIHKEKDILLLPLLITFLALTCLIFIPVLVSAEGNTAAQFLKIPISARPAAMTAFGAVSDDVNALLYNPAGLSQLSQNEFSLSYVKYFTDTNMAFLGLAVPLAHIGTFGLGVTYLSVLNIDARDAQENQAGSFGSTDWAVTLSYAKENLWGNLNAGASLKVVGETIDATSANGLAGDVGVLWIGKEPRASIGLEVENVGTGLQFINVSDPLPLGVVLSGAYWPVEQIVVGTDVDMYVLENKTYVSLGGEDWLTKEFALRLGYKFGTDLGPLSGLTGGIGLAMAGYSVDYAAGDAGDLGTLHRVSLGIKF